MLIDRLDTSNWKQDHLDFKHQGKHREYKDWCLLCKNLSDAEDNNELEGDELGVIVKDSVASKAVFGK